MSKNDDILGISISHGILSLTLMKNGHIKKSVYEEIPDNIVDGIKILAQNLFADFIRDKIQEHGIKCRKAAYVIADEDIFKRTIRLPRVDDSQIRLNIPFEFRDYIHGELNKYAFDYVKRQSKEDDGEYMDILAYAIPISTIEQIREILGTSGLRLVQIMPEASVYEALLHSLEKEEDVNKEICFLDIGKRNIRMLIFNNGEYKLSHPIEGGEMQIIRCISDELGVDMHLATTYYRTNYENCNDLPSVKNAVKDISIEVLKGLNFYEMSDMRSRLNDVAVCGTGAMSAVLMEILRHRVDKKVITMDELFPQYEQGADFNLTYASVGVLLKDNPNLFSEHTLVDSGRKKAFKWLSFAGGLLAVGFATALFSKYAIYDKFTELSKEKARTESLQNELDMQMKFVEGSQDMLDEYAHYTYEDFTEEEKARVSRLDVAKIADLINAQGAEVNEFNLMGDVLSVEVTTDSLESVSSITQAIRSADIVDACSVQAAETNDMEALAKERSGRKTIKEQTVPSDPTVTAEINIYLKTASADSKGDLGQ